EHAEALEADLLRHYGLDLLDWHRGRLSSRRLAVLLQHLPRDSAVARELHGEAAEWSPTDYLLAQVIDQLAESNWMFATVNRDEDSDPLDFPKPVPRPGQGSSRSSAQDPSPDSPEHSSSDSPSDSPRDSPSDSRPDPRPDSSHGTGEPGGDKAAEPGGGAVVPSPAQLAAFFS
ncbi:hypothetical protein ACFU76_36690, partial [Streptomyces sp. NPDC057539]|uniref:hypothetical protein n=1 Tax=Streptomyces sp. NPDC057539 TaxID=3346159 RepID=UPI0036C86FA2